VIKSERSLIAILVSALFKLGVLAAIGYGGWTLYQRQTAAPVAEAEIQDEDGEPSVIQRMLAPVDKAKAASKDLEDRNAETMKMMDDIYEDSVGRKVKKTYVDPEEAKAPPPPPPSKNATGVAPIDKAREARDAANARNAELIKRMDKLYDDQTKP